MLRLNQIGTMSLKKSRKKTFKTPALKKNSRKEKLDKREAKRS